MNSNDRLNNFYSILITTGSRLHGGFYHIGRSWKVLWGALGFYVEEPTLKIKIKPCNKTVIEAPDEVKELMLKYLDGSEDVCIKVDSYIPRHVGLGSTTQTLLAVLCGLKILKNEPCDPVEISKPFRIAKYSGVGTLLFKYGGFVIDSGLPDPQGPRALLHLSIPEEWRFVIVLPKLRKGLSEEEEDNIMKNPWEPSGEVERLISRGALRLATGLVRKDIEEVISGLKEVQSGTGMYFRKVQGSSYRSDLATLVAEAEKDKIYLAQSSWGPTLYTITTADQATTIYIALKKLLKIVGIDGRVWITKPRNRGFEAIRRREP